jgi:hypothetical protein
MFGCLTIFITASSRFLKRRSWSTFLIATVSPVSRQVAWKTTPKEPLPTTRVVEKEKVGPAGAAARAEAVAPEEVVAAAAPLLVAPAAVAPPPPSPPREATGAVRITWEPEAGSPSTTRPS